MSSDLRLMCVLAHPDDESLGVGGTLARYSAEGVGTYVICATRGERGRYGDAVERPHESIVGVAREAELRAAARELGVREVHFLDYIDKDLDQADPGEVIGKIVGHIRRVRPQVILTFAPDGGYGHPDHIAISQFAGAAIVCAADPSLELEAAPTHQPAHHRVAKFYYIAWTPGKWQAYTEAFRDLKFNVDGVDRRAVPWPDWEITTRINTERYWERVWQAVLCHKTQLTIYQKLEHLSEENHKELWGSQEFYRVFSSVNGGRKLETDLFAGLR